MQRLIFILIFISFSSTVFPQWLVDGGNLIWPYGDVSISNNVSIGDTLSFFTSSSLYPSYIYNTGFDDEGSWSNSTIITGTYGNTIDPLFIIDGTGLISGKYNNKFLFAFSPTAHKFYGPQGINQYFQLSFPNNNPTIRIQDTTSISITISMGSSSPENVISSFPGSLYLRTDGITDSTLYIKESGTGNTGWVAK